MLMEVISIILGVLLLGLSGYGGFESGRFYAMLDVPSLILILAFTVPVLFKNGVWEDFKRAWKLLKKKYTCHLGELRRSLDVVEMMQKQIIYAGILCMLLTFIIILSNLSDLESLGPNIAVSILSMSYAIVLEMLLLPLQLETKRRIIDYMREDTDEESAPGSFAGQEAEERKEATDGADGRGETEDNAEGGQL